MRQRFDNAELMGARIWTQFKLKSMSLVLTGNITIDNDSPPVLNLDANGSGRNVTMPTEEEGLTFLVNNISSTAVDLTIKNPAAATIGTCSQAEMMLVGCYGGVWYCRLLGTTT